MVQYRDFEWAALLLLRGYSYAGGSDGAAVICGRACGVGERLQLELRLIEGELGSDLALRCSRGSGRRRCGPGWVAAGGVGGIAGQLVRRKSPRDCVNLRLNRRESPLRCATNSAARC